MTRPPGGLRRPHEGTEPRQQGAGGPAGGLGRAGGAAFNFVYLAAIDISEQKACGFIMGTIAYHSTPWRYSTTAP